MNERAVEDSPEGALGTQINQTEWFRILIKMKNSLLNNVWSLIITVTRVLKSIIYVAVQTNAFKGANIRIEGRICERKTPIWIHLNRIITNFSQNS